MFVGFGRVDEWHAFERARPDFIRNVAKLFRTFNTVFARVVRAEAPDADKLIFHLGMLCVEDFKEILLLCANGFGIGGQKILRGLYEKAVTADYLAAYPEEARKFLDYFWIHTKKDLNHQKNLYGKDHWDPAFEAEVFLEYEKVKDQYMEVLCKTCETTRPQMSWTKLSTEALGKKSESPIAGLYLSCYFAPTLQTHSTMGAIFSRLKPFKENDTIFSSQSTPHEALRVLQNAHFIMLNVLNTQMQRFDLDIEEELMQRAQELDESWPELSDKESAKGPRIN
jgi:hypothetical protein